MKTAVSLPDDLFARAEELAKELSVSRSELYARALKAYVESRRRDDVTRRLDEVYGRDAAPPLDPVLAALQGLSLGREDW